MIRINNLFILSLLLTTSALHSMDASNNDLGARRVVILKQLLLQVSLMSNDSKKCYDRITILEKTYEQN